MGKRKVSYTKALVHWMIIFVAFIFLGQVTSCGGSDDDSTSATRITTGKIIFSGGENSDATDADTLASTNVFDVTVDAGSGLAAGEVPASGATAKVCSITLKATQALLGTDIPFPPLGDGEGVEYEGGATATDSIANMITALDSAAEHNYQGYKFQLEPDDLNDADTTKNIQLSITPKPNVAYALEIEQHATDCSQTKVKISIPPVTSLDSEGFPAKGVLIIKKGKAESTEDEKITIDGFKVNLGKKPLTAAQIVDKLVHSRTGVGFQGRDFKADSLKKDAPMKAYLGGGFYRGSKPSGTATATKCSNQVDEDESGNRTPIPVEGWQKGWACFILTRILNGEGGNGEVPLKFDFTKKK